MSVLALYSIKGGVGKTTAAVNLAWLAAREGSPTLLWDLDPQGAASYALRVKPKVKGGGKALLKGADFDARVKGTDHEGLDLLPADFSYRNMDLVLDSARRKRKKRLRRVLKPVVRTYEHVLLDCPPSISLLSENVFRAADALLVPLVPTTLSVRTLEQLARHRDDSELDVDLMPFFCMVDRRKRLHREVVATLPRDHPEILETSIPESAVAERMAERRAPLHCFAPASGAARAFAALWEEIGARLGR